MTKIVKQEVSKEFYRWINCWALRDSRPLTKEEKKGYEKCIHDVMSMISCPNAYPLNGERPNGYDLTFKESS